MDTPVLVALITVGGPFVTFVLTRVLDGGDIKKLKERITELRSELQDTADEYEERINALKERNVALRKQIGDLKDTAGKPFNDPIDDQDGADDTKATAEKDRFGSPLGTPESKVNNVLTDAPKSMKEIILEANVSKTMYHHLNDLVYAGYVEQTEEGKYKLKPSGLSAIDAAAKLLGENGQAMSSKEMIAAMKEKGYWESPRGKTPDETLSSAINREINRKGQNSRFKRTAPGRFAFNSPALAYGAPAK